MFRTPFLAPKDARQGRFEKGGIMHFDLLRDRVRRAIARLDLLPDRESDELAEAVEECLRLAEENQQLDFAAE
jgi:hypothetical protein